VVIRCLIALLLLSGLGAAEAVFKLNSAALPNTNARATITVSALSQDSRDLVLPAVPGVTWIDYRRNDVRISRDLTAGTTSRTEVWSLLFKLDQRERWDIGRIGVKLRDGSVLNTEPIELEATVADPRLQGDFFCTLRFEPAVIVPGQVTQAVYEIFIRDPRGVNLDDGIGVQLPDEAIRLGDNDISDDVVYDVVNNRWTVFRIRFPLTMSQPGEHRVGGQQGFVRQRGFRNEHAGTYPIKPGVLTVKQLPLAGRPDDFLGLIGPVTITAALERESLSVGEGTGLTVTVTGRQTDLLDKLPPIHVPGLRLRALNDERGTDQRSFHFNIEPERTGSYTIPTISLPYFDPEQGSYRQARSGNLHLEVLPGRQRQLAIAGSRANADPGTTTGAAPQMPAPLRGAGRARPSLTLGWVLLALGALIGTGLGLGGKLYRRRPGPRVGRALRAAGSDLAALNRALHQLHAACTEPEQRATIDAAITAVEQARFGSGQLDAATLESIHAMEGWA
jgi:hypothetical protein